MPIKRDTITRRDLLKSAAGAALVGMTSMGQTTSSEDIPLTSCVTKGRINQSLTYWCFQPYWDVEQMCRIAKQLGCKAVGLVEPEDWAIVKKYGLVNCLTSSHLYIESMNNPAYQPMCIEKMRTSIDNNAQAGFPSVITFTGSAETEAGTIDAEEGMKNCVDGYKKIVGYAEEKGVTLCLEILNSRDPVEMKGHPGYQGDHTDYCIEIIKKVGSPRLKLLFDIYHVQIMDGDITRRIQEHKDYIGHYHTAGVPGRNEIDDTQEVNYKAVMETIVKTGYKGYVSHEFIPTRDPLQGVKDAITICDV
ncbi:MAG: hydroxypyruvate isomerase family protein [Planctomycetota bacterium]|jgi:hydroxypyruvate isomerase